MTFALQQPTHTWYDLVLYVVFGLGILLLLVTWEPLTFRRWTVHVGNQGGKPGIWLDPPKKTGSKKALDRETAKLVYDAMLEQQGGHCALCPSKPKTRRLCVDHDHATGEVRGLLCHRCDRALPVWMRETWLLAAAAYLRRSKARDGARVRLTPAARLEVLQERQRACDAAWDAFRRLPRGDPADPERVEALEAALGAAKAMYAAHP